MLSLVARIYQQFRLNVFHHSIKTGTRLKSVGHSTVVFEQSESAVMIELAVICVLGLAFEKFLNFMFVEQVFNFHSFPILSQFLDE